MKDLSGLVAVVGEVVSLVKDAINSVLKLKIKAVELEINLYAGNDELLKATVDYLRGDL